jgi:exonuclease III
MKIITWNCNGALRKKTKCIDQLDADVLVIQECEDPARSSKTYRKWAGEYLWKGESKNKGIGIFARKGSNVEALDWEGEYTLRVEGHIGKSQTWKSNDLQSFLPCKINNEYTLLAVWTKKAKSPNFRYIGQLWLYLQIHKNKLRDHKTIICGDFNSNSIWDEWDRWWNHSDVVDELCDIGINSLYHHKTGDKQGDETKNTLYMNRNLNRSYHIDYAFLSDELLEKSAIEILEPSFWLEFSDHVPVVFEIR